MQAYVAYEGISDADKAAGGKAPCHQRDAWVCFCFVGQTLVVDYTFCHEPKAEQRAIACAEEWRRGAAWARRRAA